MSKDRRLVLAGASLGLPCLFVAEVFGAPVIHEHIAPADSFDVAASVDTLPRPAAAPDATPTSQPPAPPQLTASTPASAPPTESPASPPALADDDGPPAAILYFAVADDRLADPTSLDRLFEGLDDVTELRFRVVGHADRAGARDLNERLARSRTNAVANELLRRGVPRTAIRKESMGSDAPISAEDEALNRRVEIYLLSK